ncbi:MAG: Single-stranded DNA binding protein [Halobacteria archaeon]|nr:Single-stranded DNA binding protein [Halobacteria archaeon]
MNGTDVSRHARELAESLDADADEVEERLRNLIEYSVPIDEAKRTLRRRYSSDSPSDSTDEDTTSEPVRIDGLTTEDSGVTVEGKILSVGRRSIRSGGDSNTIYEGEIADETDAIKFTAWEEFGLSAGDSVRIEGAGVREWNGERQINLGSETRVEDSDDVDTEYEVHGVREIRDLTEGDRAVDLEAAVVELEERSIDGREGETRIKSGVLADSSGRLPFTDWENRDFEEGDTLRITNSYVNEYRGVPQINMGEYTQVGELEKEIEVEDEAPKVTVREAVEDGGAFDVAVTGTVISVKDGSGIIKRCPDCGRVIQKGQCRSHGEVDGVSDMRTKAVLDDGTGALTLVLGRDLTEKVYGGSLEDAEEEAREAMDQSVVEDAIADEMVGREWEARGNVSVGEYGANMEAKDLWEVDLSPESMAREVIQKYE